MCVGRLLKSLICAINVLLGLAFLLLALVGVLLTSSEDFVKALLEKLSTVVPNEGADVAEFIVQNAGPIAGVLIAVGVIVAIICGIGAAASCCGCGILVKVYAAALGILIVAQFAGIIVVFAVKENPEKISKEVLEKLAAEYGNDDTIGKISSVLWEILSISNSSACCGINGHGDFKGKGKPRGCNTAVPNIPTCTDKVDAFLGANKNMVLAVFLAILVPQVALFILSIVSVCIPI